jgi:DNA polymerase III subunit epsilon
MCSMSLAFQFDLAAEAGCEVEVSVTKERTLLIVGDQDILRLAVGQIKSSKHLKAESLIAKGRPIGILRETDFMRLIPCEGVLREHGAQKAIESR